MNNLRRISACASPAGQCRCLKWINVGLTWPAADTQGAWTQEGTTWKLPPRKFKHLPLFSQINQATKWKEPPRWHKGQQRSFTIRQSCHFSLCQVMCYKHEQHISCFHSTRLPFSKSLPLAVGRASDPALGWHLSLDQSCKLQSHCCEVLPPALLNRGWGTLPGPSLAAPAPGQRGPLALTKAALGQEAPGCCPFIGQVEAGLLLLWVKTQHGPARWLLGGKVFY